jgi:electron transport complex protein RnfB
MILPYPVLFISLQQIWPAGAIMVGLGGSFALVLLIASIKLKAEIDPKIEQIHNVLPKIDCGACGFAGCSSYAKAVAKNPELIGKCAPGGAATAAKIADILNLQVSGEGHPQRPIVHCNAHKDDKTFYASYQGIESCTAANALANVQACKFGCLGYGDCVEACKFDALHIVDGLATVDYEKCTGCTACSKACPRNLIEMVPFPQENIITVACSSKENGKTTHQMCKAGCIACGICAKQSDMFVIAENLSKVDYQKYSDDEKAKTAMQKCPTKVIIRVGKNIDAHVKPAGKTAAE